MAMGMVMALAQPGQAGRCPSVTACVELARATPGRFTVTLQRDLKALPTDALLAGLEPTDPNPALVGRVRGLVLAAAYGRKLTDAQIDALYARYVAGSDEVAELLRGPLPQQPRGKQLLVAYMHAHDDTRALRVAWALAAEPRGTEVDRRRARELVWSRYLRERKANTSEHQELLNFMGNQPKDFAAPAQALATQAYAQKEALRDDDLDVMSRQPTHAVLVQLLQWARTQPPARIAFMRALQSASEEVLRDLRSSQLSATEALLLEATRSPEMPQRLGALHAWSRLYPPPLPPGPAVLLRYIALSADPEVRVREAAYRPMVGWIAEPSIRQAVLDGTWRWERAAVGIVSRDGADKLAPWRADALLTVLKSLPEPAWLDGSWQHELAFIGLRLERTFGRKAGFDAFSAELAGRCGTNDLPQGVSGLDLQLLDPVAYAAWLKNEPQPLTPEAQARATSERATQLRAARDKLLAALKR